MTTPEGRSQSTNDSLSDLDTTEQAGECARCHQWAPLRLFDTTQPNEGGAAWLCQECPDSTDDASTGEAT